MQLFRLHSNHLTSASMLPDKYTYNQIREGEQSLRYALYPEWEHPDYPVSESNSHLHHPLTEWSRLSSGNWLEAYMVISATNEEYKRRYNNGDHASWVRLRDDVYPAAWDILPQGKEPTIQPCCFDECYYVADPSTEAGMIENYRNYVREAKAPKEWFKYERGDRPEWL